MCSPYLYKQYDKIKAGGSHTNKLNLGDIPKLYIPIPPLPEQYRIAAKIDELMILCDQLKAKLGKAGEQQRILADAIVAQAVSA